MGKQRTKPSPVVGQSQPKPLNELVRLTGDLVDMCSRPIPAGPREMWNEHLEIKAVLGDIERLQQPHELRFQNDTREGALHKFIEWCEDNQISAPGLKPQATRDEEFGLFAVCELNEGSQIIEIPRSAIFTLERARESKTLGPALTEDPMLSGMSNVALAFALLCEKFNSQSSFRPYIEFLPRQFTTPTFFDDRTFEYLKGSLIYEDALRMHRNICRQYGYFYQLLANNTSYMMKTPLNLENFTYKAYRWATSAVVTRLNYIPTEKDANEMTSALIPFWDLANHKSATQVSSDYLVDKQVTVCYAMKDYRVGDEVFNCYGDRSNGELLIHNGFVVAGKDCPRGVMRVRLGQTKADKLFDRRVALLSHYGLLPTHEFMVHARPPHIPPEMLFFLRVFNASQSQLDAVASRIGGEEANANTSSIVLPIDKENELKVWEYMKNRFSLLLKVYPRSVEDIEKVLCDEEQQLSASARFALELVRQEQKILEIAIVHAEHMATMLT